MDPWVAHAPLPNDAGYPPFPDSMLLVPSAGKLYLLNIYGNSQSCVYDIDTDAWGLLPYTLVDFNNPFGGFVGSTFYVAGNDSGTGDIIIDTLDLDAGTLTSVATLATTDPLFDYLNYPGTMAVLGDRYVYLLAQTKLLVWDSVDDVWSSVDFMDAGAAHYDGVLTTDGTALFLVCGFNGVVGSQGGGTGSDASWIETLVGTTWTRSSSFVLPTGFGLEDIAAVYDEGQVYVLGGESYDNDWNSTTQSDVWVYTISSDEWALGEPMADASASTMACVVDGALWRCGGYNDTTDDSRVLESSQLGVAVNHVTTKESVDGTLTTVGSSGVYLGSHNLHSAARDRLVLDDSFGALSYERWLRLTWGAGVTDVTVALVALPDPGVEVLARQETAFATPVNTPQVMDALTTSPVVLGMETDRLSEWLVLQTDVLPRTSVGVQSLGLLVSWTDPDTTARTQTVPLTIDLSLTPRVAPVSEAASRSGFRRRFNA